MTLADIDQKSYNYLMVKIYIVLLN